MWIRNKWKMKLSDVQAICLIQTTNLQMTVNGNTEFPNHYYGTCNHLVEPVRIYDCNKKYRGINNIMIGEEHYNMDLSETP